MSAVPSSLMPALPTPGGPRHGADLRGDVPADAFAGLFLGPADGHLATPAETLAGLAPTLLDVEAKAPEADDLHHVSSQLQWLRDGQSARMPRLPVDALAGAERLPGRQWGGIDAAAAAVERAALARALASDRASTDRAPAAAFLAGMEAFEAGAGRGATVQAGVASLAAALVTSMVQPDAGAHGALHGLTPLPTSPLMTPVRADGLLPPLPGQALPPGADPFTDGVASRMAWMAGQKIGRAEIRLSPAELGTIDIRLELDGKQVRAEFGSAHADVRAALEAGMQRLRDMLAGQGLHLAQADVGDGSASSRGHRGPGLGADGGGDGRGSAEGNPTGSAHASGEDEAIQTHLARHDGILDTYA